MRQQCIGCEGNNGITIEIIRLQQFRNVIYPLLRICQKQTLQQFCELMIISFELGLHCLYSNQATGCVVGTSGCVPGVQR